MKPTSHPAHLLHLVSLGDGDGRVWVESHRKGHRPFAFLFVLQSVELEAERRERHLTKAQEKGGF